METKGEFIVVNFDTVGKKQLNLQLCIDKGLMEFIHNSWYEEIMNMGGRKWTEQQKV